MASPVERPVLVVAIVIMITNDGVIIDTREIDNGARLNISNLVGLARGDLSRHEDGN